MRLLITVKTSSIAMPHPCQIVATLHDPAWKEVQRASLLVKPDGWEIPKDVADAIGFTSRDAAMLGLPISTVMRVVKGLTELAGDWFAYNEKFISEALTQGMRDAGSPNDWQARTMKGNCVMRAAQPMVGLKTDDGVDRVASFHDAARHFFQRDLTDRGAPEDHATLIDMVRHLLPLEVFP